MNRVNNTDLSNGGIIDQIARHSVQKRIKGRFNT